MIVHINGQTIDVPDGCNVSVINGVVVINGDRTDLSGVHTLVIEGNAASVVTDKASVQVKGAVTGPIKAGGSISCGNVGGDIIAGGSVSCDDVGGRVRAGGSISCNKVYNGKLP